MKLNERKLTKAEVSKREDIIMDMKKNKRELTKRYGKDAEKVMYGRATNLAKKQLENMDPKSKLREMIKTALQNPKKADLNKDGKLSDYEKKRGAAIEKSIIDEIEVDDSYSERETMEMEYNQNPEKFLDSIVSILNRFSNDGTFTSSNVDDNYLNTFELEGSPLKVGLNKEFSFDLLSGGEILMSNKDLDTILLASQEHSSIKEDKTLTPPPISLVNKRRAKADMKQFTTGKRADKGVVNKADGTKDDKYNSIILGVEKDGNQTQLKTLDDFDFTTNKEGKKIPSNYVEYYLADSNYKTNSYKIPKYQNVKEDLDLGHQDDEPHMLKANLYRIGKYAMELYQMMDKFEGQGEVDLPHWWQSKIIKSESMITSAKHYLDFELKEPEIDAMVDVASEEGAISEIDNNDPILMKMRAAKDKKKDFGSEYGKAVQKAYKGKNNDAQISSLERKRNQLMRDMEQEAEPEGGPIADRYGRELNKIDAKISKLRGKPLTYDQAISEEKSQIPSQEEVDRFFEETQNEMHYLASKPVMGQEKTFNNVEVEAWDEYDLSNWNALVRKKKEGRSPFGESKYSQLAEKIVKNLKKKALNEDVEEWPKEHPSRYNEYRFELEKVSPTYKGKPGRALYKLIDIESGELKATPAFGKVEQLIAYADDLIKPQGGTQSSQFGESLKKSK